MNIQKERHTHWQKLIEEQMASGLSRREFCQQHVALYGKKCSNMGVVAQ